ncbi:MAG: IS1634 family transposase, partial [Pseudonocardiaceae bacterium]
YHRTEDRVRAHVLICMLAAYLVWHLRKAWAPLCFGDEDRPARVDPVAPAQRSDSALAKASRQRDADDEVIHSFGTLLDHLGTLTRNQVRFGGIRMEVLSTPTPLQRRAFELLDTNVALKLM